MNNYMSHQKSLRRARIYDSNNPYFITMCIHEKQSILLKANIPDTLITSMQWFISSGEITFLGFVIMPDHLHWSFALNKDCTLDRVISRYKSFNTKEINKIMGRSGKVWQDGYYDHLLRDIGDFKIKLNYMHNNPVRKGLSEEPEDYLYSSAHNNYSSMVNWDYIGY